MRFRLSPDVEVHKRSIYTILELLGDIGGLFDALKGIFSILLSMNFAIFGNPIQEFLLRLIYRKDDKKLIKTDQKSQSTTLR